MLCIYIACKVSRVLIKYLFKIIEQSRSEESGFQTKMLRFIANF